MSLKTFYKEYEEELTEALGADYNFPKLLKKLMNFDLSIDGEDYIERFELTIPEDVVWDYFEANEVEDDFLEILEENLIPFSIAEENNYVFWLQKGKSIDELPIITINSSGFVELVASNLHDFFKLLPTGQTGFAVNDAELAPYVDLELLKKFRKWMKEDLKIDYAETNEEITQINNKAKELYKNDLDKWLAENGYDQTSD